MASRPGAVKVFRRWVVDASRVRFELLPLHASRLNQIESFPSAGILW